MSAPRIAVVGAGWWSANHHVPSLAEYPAAELVALCDPQRARAQELARRYDVGTVVTGLDEVVELGADGVIIATPHTTHHSLAAQALDAGLHVLVEKPLTTSAADAFDLVRRSESAGRHLAVGYTDQYAPTAARVQEAVQSDIGEIVQVMAEFTSNTVGLFAAADAGEEGADPADQHPATYGAQAAGGQAHTQLTHVMGMVCWVTGRQVAEVAAFTDHRGHDVDVDDAAAFRLTGGGTGVVTSSGMAGATPRERRAVRYLGTRGTVDQDMTSGRAELRRCDGTVVTITVGAGEEGDRTLAPARAFADLVAGHGSNPAPARPAAAAAAFIEATLDSAGSRAFAGVRQLPS